MAFVGRESELARLAGALERAAGGERSKVCLVGRSGVGLTRLLDEVIGRLVGLSGLVVIRGAAQEPRSGEPYAALADALEEGLAQIPDERLAEIVGSGRRPISALLPSLDARLSVGEVDPGEPPLVASADQAGGRFTEAVVGLLERLAGEGTILLVLEDLHWADPGTRRFVDTLLRIGRPARLCLVVTYRPEELHVRHPARPLADALAADPGTELVEVPPLDRHLVLRLLEAQLGERPSAAFVAAVMEGSGGLPRLVEQLAAVRRGDFRVRLSEPFEEVVRARLRPLSVGAVRCLRLLAAARRPMPVGLLRRIDLPGGGLPEGALEEAVESGLARLAPAGTAGTPPGTRRRDRATGHRRASRRHPGSPQGGRLAALDRVGIVDPGHAEAIERLDLPADHQPIHAALAAALIGHPAEQAWHLEAAMRFAAARNAHLAAGFAAQAIEPGESALLHLQRVLELAGAREARVPGLGLPLGRLLELAAEAAFAADMPHRAAGLLDQAIHESTRTQSLARALPAAQTRRVLESQVGLLYVRLAQFRSAAGDLEGALAALASAGEIVPTADVAGKAHIFAVQAQQLMLAGRFPQSTPAAERVRQLAERSPEVAVADLASATCTLGVDAAYGGDIEAGLRLLEEAEPLAVRSGRLDELMRVYADSMLLYEMDGRLEPALTAAGRGIGLCRRWGAEAAYGSFLRGNAAAILLSLGRWSEAEAEARLALEWSPGRLAAFPLHILGAVLVESRADEESGRIVGRILLELESSADGRSASAVQRIAVSHALWRDDPADAVRAARHGWGQVDESTEAREVALAASTTAEAAAALADAARARRDVVTVAAMSELAATVVGEAEARLAGRDGAGGRGPARQAGLDLATARAHLERCRGRHHPAAWASIARSWLELGLPYLAAKARWWEAEAALHVGDRAGARTSLQHSWALAEALPARPLLRELARLARRARLPSPAGRRSVAALIGPVDGVRAPALVAVGPGVGSGPARPVPIGLPGLTERLQAAPIVPRDPFNLSPREIEVLGLIVQGGTNRDISGRLFISERTVGVHVRNILGKLGVGGRIEAANVAIRLGLVAVPVSVRLAPGA